MNLIYGDRHPASFRDPTGTVFNIDGRIVRGLSAEGVKRFHTVKESGLIAELEQTEKIVASKNIDSINLSPKFMDYLEHELIPFISYPYEWPFSLLKKAALLHLSIQIQALDRDVVLSDASAYNIQFRGISPIFIDVLSFRPYQEGELWGGHRQFCEQFLNPLLLHAIKGVPYQEWYRGTLEGIPTESLADLLPLKSWFSFKSLVHVLLPARSQKSSDKKKDQTIQKIQKTTIPKAVYKSFLTQLHNWIETLTPKKINSTVWENYSVTRIYKSQELSAKRDFIAEFATKVSPKLLWDLGCNDGEFAELALQNGAGAVIGFDVDLGALEKAVLRAKINNLNFLPLYQQITNPSPRQGWLLQEREAVMDRGSPDAIVALAFIHHLTIGHNIPLSEAVSWLVSLAPTGVVEFVKKTDPTVQKMLALKGDIFPDYTEENFLAILLEKNSIIKTNTISETGRSLYWYERKI